MSIVDGKGDARSEYRVDTQKDEEILQDEKQ